jgi:hypothetical protein
MIAILHSYRFFGLVFILPGVVGNNLPEGFAQVAAYGDFATGLLAILALLAIRICPLFWSFVVGFTWRARSTSSLIITTVLDSTSPLLREDWVQRTES